MMPDLIYRYVRQVSRHWPIVVLALGGCLVIHGKTDVGTLVVFISGFQKIADPWNQLGTFYRSVSNARVTFGLVADALKGSRPAPGGQAPRTMADNAG